MDAAARRLRDLLARLLAESSVAGGILEQMVRDALTRQEARSTQQLSRVEQELARLSEQLHAAAKSAGGPGQQEMARSLQQLRSEVAALGAQLQSLARRATSQAAGPGLPRWHRLWLPTLLALLCTALAYDNYILFSTRLHRPLAAAQAPASTQEPLSHVQASPSPGPVKLHRRGPQLPGETQQPGAPAAVEATVPVPVAAARPSGSWERVWDLAVTQAFSCPGDPGASTLLQCVCPDVHPSPPVGYPWAGVGERCPPGPAWRGSLAVAALQAVLKVEEPDLQAGIDGQAGRHLSPALDRLAERCSLQVEPDLQGSPGDPGAAALRMLGALRSRTDCLGEH
jgi:hypothetical protein